MGDEHQGVSRVLLLLAELSASTGKTRRAADLIGQAIELARTVGLWRDLLACLDHVVELLVDRDPEGALQLASVVGAARARAHVTPPARHQERLTRSRSAAEAHLDAAVIARADAAGEAMGIDQATAEAL